MESRHNGCNYVFKVLHKSLKAMAAVPKGQSKATRNRSKVSGEGGREGGREGERERGREGREGDRGREGEMEEGRGERKGRGPGSRRK